MTVLNDFWDNKVSNNHKHFPSNMSKEKIRKHQERCFRTLLQHVNWTEVNLSIDWGCGGGILTSLLQIYSDVIILDISKKSLIECANNLKIKPILSVLYPFQLNKIPSNIIDLIHCTAVIHHFSDLQYWNDIVKIWNKINPKYLIFQVKLSSKKDSDRKEIYYRKHNYINGLYLSYESVLKSFPKYQLMSFTEEKAFYSKSLLGFFVFRRKE
jgi:2-polyprenyl-3-methyl-5-hydroxy-6-metoxy-1,4-benzoquinol methylase